MSQPRPALVWFRHDLRLDDHPALNHAAAAGPVVGLFVLDDALDGRPLGAAARWWLHQSLLALERSLAAHGVPLLLARGDARRRVAEAAAAIGAGLVTWNAGGTPFLRHLDREVGAALAIQGGAAVVVARSGLLAEPEELRTGAGRPYQVFTPFWKALQARGEPAAPLPVPAGLHGTGPLVWGEALGDWGLLPTAPDWAGGMRRAWTPGEAGAEARLNVFLARAVASYAQRRDLPAEPATARLSPHLRFGEVSPRRLWAVCRALAGSAAEPFLREVAWREFNHHLLFQHPAMADQPLRAAFAAFPWADDRAALIRWQRGRTGFPLVDAGMRELWETGWMHNRVRMVVGSFLVKDLLLPWQWGEAWFWDTLVDACPANNPGNWQWVAGCGADAAPYFRVFNPETQRQKFDPSGGYVDRWVPEASGGLLGAAGRQAYPRPMVDHARARQRALAAYAAMGAGG